MSTPRKVDETDIHAYLDGELPPERAADVTAHVNANPEIAERLGAYRRNDEQLRTRFDSVLEEPIPERLRVRRRGMPALARYAAAVCWLYPSFIFFNFLILTETLFTFLLVAFVLLVVLLVQTPRPAFAIACGIALGLGALTRSILWPLPLILCPLLAVLIRAPLGRRVALPLLVLAGYAAVVAPWAVRNTRLQGVVTIVDTMGGMNLRMGNYEYTPDDRMWDAVALNGEKSWVHGLSRDFAGQTVTEGQKEKWAQRKALEYMRANPGITLRRALIKFADFWGLEREFAAGVQNGFYAPPAWLQVFGSVAIVLAYVIVIAAGAAGIWLAAPGDWRSV